jgi:hypothetical protein
LSAFLVVIPVDINLSIRKYSDASRRLNGSRKHHESGDSMSRSSRDLKPWVALPVCIAILALVAPIWAAQLDWKKDWEQTLAAARNEGQVTIYIYRYEGLLQDFKREFPGIHVNAVTGRGNQLTNRIMAERRAGEYIVDVYSGGTNSL